MKPPNKIELEFSFTQSEKYVVRSARLPGGKKISSRLRVDGQNPLGSDACSTFDYAYIRMRKRTDQPSTKRIVHVVDLFSGCGGFSLGVMEACNTVGLQFLSSGAVDWDSNALGVYKRNFPEARIYNYDIRKLLDGQIGSKPTKTERRFLSLVSPIDFLLAGPPCQGHSDLNNHTRRRDERNILYERVARLVELTRPKHIMIENVPAAVHGKHKAVERTIEAIGSFGYDVVSDIVNLAHLGVPQKRKRHVVIASILPVIPLDEIIEKHKVETARTVRWAIGDLENEPSNGVYTRPTNHTGENRLRIDYLHDNNLYDLPNELRPPCHRDGCHTYRSMYGRMSYDNPSQTITSGFTSPGQGRFIHPEKRRTITPHEAARLQFFPDYFDFSVAETRTSLTTMIGNAVPMKLSYIISLELLAAS